MLAPCNDLNVPAIEGYDCTKQLGITKFEPPVELSPRSGNPVSKKKKNPHFKEYGGLDNFKWYPDLFAEGEEVVITEKVHGTNFRAGYVPMHVDTLWKRIKKFFRVLPEFEFVFGSNKVQLQDRKYKGYYEKEGAGNVYEEAVENYGLRNKLDNGEVVYGEVYGSSVQKNYMYGCKEGERRFIVFDLMVNGEYVDTDTLIAWCEARKLPVVPLLYRGPFNAAKAKELTLGDSVLEPTQKVREGVVIKPTTETKCHMGRKVLKLISDEYLLKDDNTDFH
jgi:RNA ligase (TIGR02306 family)